MSEKKKAKLIQEAWRKVVSGKMSMEEYDKLRERLSNIKEGKK